MNKILIGLIFLFLPVVVYAQVSVTGTAGTGYYLVSEQGDTLTLRGATPFYATYRVALSDAINYAGDNNVRVFVRSNMDERVTADFGYDDIIIEYVPVPGDTVYVPADTVYVGSEDVLFTNFNTELAQRNNWNVFTTTAVSYADSVYIDYFCTDDTIEPRKVKHPIGVLYDRFVTDCMDDFQVDFRFYKDGVGTDSTKYWPAWLMSGDEPLFGDQRVFTPGQFNSSNWTQHWHGSSILSSDGTSIILQDTSSGSNVWIYDMPDSQQMEVYMVSSTTGASPHIRALATPYGYAQDIYYSRATGMLHYAYWNNSDSETPWAQGMYTLVEQIPIEGDADFIHKVINVDSEYVRIKAWLHQEPEDWTYTIEIPEQYKAIEGGLGIGAHSVNIRYIQFLSVGTGGIPAPRQ